MGRGCVLKSTEIEIEEYVCRYEYPSVCTRHSDEIGSAPERRAGGQGTISGQGENVSLKVIIIGSPFNL